jgi:hypothetical protein
VDCGRIAVQQCACTGTTRVALLDAVLNGNCSVIFEEIVSLDSAKSLPCTDSNTVLDVLEKDANVFAVSRERPLVIERIGSNVVEVHARLGRVINI